MEDTIDAEELDRRFNQHASGEWSEPRYLFERQGPVAETLGLARSGLLRALNYGPPPDLILIDQYLFDPATQELQEHGLEFVVDIACEYSARDLERPVCVLWTQGSSRLPTPDPGLCRAFIECGGDHVVDKRLRWPERMRILEEAMDGEKWAPTPSPPKLELTSTLEALLPYLEADKTVAEIASELDRDEQRVREQRNKLVLRIKTQLGIELSGSGRTTALADACREAGCTWVPLRFRHLVERCREHLPEMEEVGH